MKTLIPSLLVLSSLHTATGREKPNILFIYSDEQSARTVSCYQEAYPWVKTP